jgi:hypothetical protein
LVGWLVSGGVFFCFEWLFLFIFAKAGVKK